MTLTLRNVRTASAFVLSATLLYGCDNGNDNHKSDPGLGATPPTTTIYAFGGTGSPASDGAEPKGSLTPVTTNGTTVLYGRTAVGGPGGTNGCGIIFSLSPSGSNYQILYSFGGSDGCDPRHDAMILNPNDGKIYGTTQGVNQGTGNNYNNWGQVFSFTPGVAIPAGMINAVHTFQGGNSDGAQQHSSFSIDPSSLVLYGQTAAGGSHGSSGDGLLYSLSTAGAFNPLYSFDKSTGSDPHGRIVLSNGTLYGIARQGGTLPAPNSSLPAYGAVYSFNPASSLFTVLHTFAGGPADGAFSDHGYLTPVSVAGKTVFFGMTQCGGSGTDTDSGSCQAYGTKTYSGGAGVIFQIDPTPGSSTPFTVVYSFQGQGTKDGAAPYGSLMYDGTYLYGTTSAGGNYNQGTVFRFAPVGAGGTTTPTIVYHFGTQATDGSKPIDNVIEVGSMLYGMTVFGGNGAAAGTGNGTIFAIPIPN